MEQKICTLCKLSKSIDLFRFRTEKGKKHLRHSRCIECVNVAKNKNRKERGHLHKFNTEFQKEYDKAYYLLHKEKKKKQQDYTKQTIEKKLICLDKSDLKNEKKQI